MKKVYSIVGLVLIFGLVVIAISSCKKASGGGIVGVYYDHWEGDEIDKRSEVFLGKATFGFRMECRDLMLDGDPTAVLVGQIQYNDHYNKIKFHGQTKDVIFPKQFCDDLGAAFANNDFLATGIYTPLPKGQFDETASGTFTLYVLDSGESGSSDTDEFGIQLLGGEYGGYTNGGALAVMSDGIGINSIELLGGNIQVFEE